MSPRRPDRRHWFRWLVPGAVVVLAPKCVLCVAAYFGLGTALGWTRAEICGAQDNEATHVVAWVVGNVVALGFAARFVRTRGLCAGRRGASTGVRLRTGRAAEIRTLP